MINIRRSTNFLILGALVFIPTSLYKLENELSSIVLGYSFSLLDNELTLDYLLAFSILEYALDLLKILLVLIFLSANS